MSPGVEKAARPLTVWERWAVAERLEAKNKDPLSSIELKQKPFKLMFPDGRSDAAGGPHGGHWSPLVVPLGGVGLTGALGGEAEPYWVATQCPGISLATWGHASKSSRYKCTDDGVVLSKAERGRTNREYKGRRKTSNTRKEWRRADTHRNKGNMIRKQKRQGKPALQVPFLFHLHVSFDSCCVSISRFKSHKTCRGTRLP